MPRTILEQGPEAREGGVSHGNQTETARPPDGSVAALSSVLVCDCSHTCREPGTESRCSANASSLFPVLWNEPHARVPCLRRKAQLPRGKPEPSVPSAKDAGSVCAPAFGSEPAPVTGL